jgi:hypothetical protein
MFPGESRDTRILRALLCLNAFELDLARVRRGERPFRTSYPIPLDAPKPTETSTSNLEQFAGTLYETYCRAVGGKAFNGDLLPNWETFRADPSKKTQSDAWIEVARTALETR